MGFLRVALLQIPIPILDMFLLPLLLVPSTLLDLHGACNILRQWHVLV